MSCICISPLIIRSAGIGRTGTFILCDINLRLAAKREEIDVFYHLRKLREQRINMVDNINQYKLVHLVLIQCLVAPDYAVQCTEDIERVISDFSSYAKVSVQMKYIEDTLWQDEAMRDSCTKVNDPIIHKKNKFEHILPGINSCLFIIHYLSENFNSKNFILQMAMQGLH